MSSYGHRNSARDMRTAGRQFAQDKRRDLDSKAVSNAETAVIDARSAYYYDTAAGTPERDAAYETMTAAEAALTALDPENSLFS